MTEFANNPTRKRAMRVLNVLSQMKESVLAEIAASTPDDPLDADSLSLAMEDGLFDLIRHWAVTTGKYPNSLADVREVGDGLHFIEGAKVSVIYVEREVVKP